MVHPSQVTGAGLGSVETATCSSGPPNQECIMADDNNPFLYDTVSRWQLCRFCMHLHNLLGELRCEAFPQGIPKNILFGADHPQRAIA